ncbi:Isonitrile hydratase [Planktothrix tepida]|uniref:Transcriptional regulator, AraC family protein n=2 Tax=Planktothrix TaxID=54304 RepID=A0A1J1LKG9_9CYAN|nr:MULTISPECIES: DJ-1/PfpI family protein [Planktothrix]CAD5952190.1 Isonitrile hydratase [Planktothrix tepida]CAD5958526.1 Isonitrile hydratase [Planktothrix pseudagardhii]CUR32678.1 Transcriptional regulator, AraC family protein [Planktothrix tepida PCC 9214]
MTQKNIAILMFNDVEILDFAGPYEVFSIASEINEDKPFNVYLVAETLNSLQSHNGLSINPDFTLLDSPVPDVIFIPGGIGTKAAMNQLQILAWIQSKGHYADLIVSVCTGALLLAKVGLLDGLVATTHHLALEQLRALAPQTTIVDNQRYVDNGKIITAAGISAGIDVSLYVIAKLLGDDKALKTAQYMEYDWKPKAKITPTPKISNSLGL